MRDVRIIFEGGPGTSQPEKFVARHQSICNLIRHAYDLQYWQLDCPEPLVRTANDIDARIPKGATREQFLQMQQTLLAERFKLIIHHGKKELPAYDMVVAKGGSKLTPSKATPHVSDATAPDAGDIKFDAVGYPVFGPRAPSTMIANGMNMTRALQLSQKPVADLIKMLSQIMGIPIHDRTGLTGTYNFGLRWVRAEGPAEEPDLLLALRTQLGLSLRSKKDLVDVIVMIASKHRPPPTDAPWLTPLQAVRRF